MGCDIHLYREKKVNGKWVTADEGWNDEYGNGVLDVPWESRFTDRDYDLFGFLAGVRSEPEFRFKEKGLPLILCDEVALLIKEYGEDGHSHSHLYLHELEEAVVLMANKFVTVSGMKDEKSYKKLIESISSADDTDWDLIYPYCKWASGTGYVDFSVDVPASFKLSGLKRLIDHLKSCGSDDSRIVFWFDN